MTQVIKDKSTGTVEKNEKPKGMRRSATVEKLAKKLKGKLARRGNEEPEGGIGGEMEERRYGGNIERGREV